MAKSKIKEPAVTVQPEGRFEMVPLFRLFPDEKQPRRIFDEVALNELVESLKTNGMLQPIMVRPNGNIVLPKHQQGPQYKIVCGERRYRAAEIANMEMVPVIIRELTDDQALEIQIVENLQRKDVNPMEEALAFVNLNHRGFKVEEIALRVGKSGTYVAQRMKLADLIEPFQEFVYAGKMTLSDATKVCRFSEEVQKELHKEARIPKDWQKRKDWDLEFWSLDDKGQDLDRAPFKTEDADLYPEAGACNKCPHNSAANKLLFPDMKRERICHNPACFSIKTGRAYTSTIESALADPEIMFCSFDTYPDKEQKVKIKAVHDMGVTLVDADAIEVVEAPEEISGWEEYRNERDDWSGDEDLTAAEKKAREAECKSEWEEGNLLYKKELEEYNQLLASGKLKKAFAVTGRWNVPEGKIVNVRLKAGKGAKMVVSENAPADTKILALEQEIAAIEQRESRNQELDREKVYNQTMESFKETYCGLTDQLHPEEWHALAVLLVDYSWAARDWCKENYDYDWDYHRAEIYKRLQSGEFTEDQLNQLVRIALFDKLVNKNAADPERFGAAGSMLAIAKVFIPEAVDSFANDQNGKAVKRQGNVQKRIGALQKEIDGLKPIEKPSKKKSNGKKST